MSDAAQLLNLPRAHGAPVGRACLRAVPEDFIVREWLGFEPDGEGAHLLLKVRKRGANTLWVAKQLARLAKVHPRDVGFAGQKDRAALAEQSFTVPARAAPDAVGNPGAGGDLGWTGVAGEGFEVLSAVRQRRKLQRGALRGNDFEILLRDFSGERVLLEQRLQVIAAAGVPNYFGPQRFGRGGGNVEAARAWFAGEGPAPQRVQRGFALSAARALIFNAVLAQRVAAATWNQLQDGEVANLHGSGSIFPVPVVDADLRERCRRLDIHPTGPLWAGPAALVAGAVAALEQRVAQQHAQLAGGLERAGLQPERRALRAAVEDLRWTISGTQVRLCFRLRRGCFATAVLHELLDNAFADEVPEADVNDAH